MLGRKWAHKCYPKSPNSYCFMHTKKMEEKKINDVRYVCLRRPIPLNDIHVWTEWIKIEEHISNRSLNMHIKHDLWETVERKKSNSIGDSRACVAHDRLLFCHLICFFSFDFIILCGASADNETIRVRTIVARHTHTHHSRESRTHTAVVAVAAASNTKIVVFILDKMNVLNRAAR